MIKINNLSFQYKNQPEIISKMNVEISNGEAVGIIGLNGSGKSTLIKLMLGILSPISGNVSYDDLDIRKSRMAIMKKVGVVWGQRTSLWWDISVQESLYAIANLYDVSLNQLSKNIDYYSKYIPIKSYWEKPLRKLSFGQRVQSDIISVLIREPEIIVLDEAFVGLDYETKQAIINLLKIYKKEHKKCIYIVTSHNFEDIVNLCSKVIAIRKKEGTTEYSIDELLSEKRTLITIKTKEKIELGGLDEDTTILESLPYETSIYQTGSVNKILKRIDWDSIDSLNIEDKTLEYILNKIF